MNANVESLINSGIKYQINLKESIDTISLFCQLCGSNLILNCINETNHMLVCSNLKVSFIVFILFSVSFLLIVKV